MGFFGKNRKHNRPSGCCCGEKHKYHNHKCTFDGIEFDSRKEMDRYIFLKSNQEKGIISDLRHHVKIEIIPHIEEEYDVQLKTKTVTKKRIVQKAIYYEADFVYTKDGKEVVSDVKGSKKTLTKVYQLKKKLLRALKNINVVEVYNPTDLV